MQPALNACVFIVDDDASVRDAMAWLLRSRRLMSESFSSADAFEKMLKEKFPGQQTPVPTQAGCILLDVRMPGQSGLALFETLIDNGLAHTWPVIFLTGHADVPTAVDSVKRGAFDFCEKPFSDNALVDRVEQALALSQERLTVHQQSAGLVSRLDELTERERDVMRLVVAGMPNKLIADQLDISVRTVEVHRSRVFEKMEVKSAVELANLLREV
ncbi:response regulator transcription factor [Limnohabitans sp. MMS-10A-178]|uniref:response regulator transcription factor n=1 Tax=Limnohabitans sp. MMS-10A-178 TaxID=1835767 RepID=UPI000D3D4290|nr:response regulator [Limnohabitans sp. MMS-10A-178]PUE16264.1 DNA-binding response regulator [Limnohabitans sp. MMS-10A-178]